MISVPAPVGWQHPTPPPRLGPSPNHRRHCSSLIREKEGLSRALTFLHLPLDSGQNLLSALEVILKLSTSTLSFLHPNIVTATGGDFCMLFWGKGFQKQFSSPTLNTPPPWVPSSLFSSIGTLLLVIRFFPTLRECVTLCSVCRNDN